MSDQEAREALASVVGRLIAEAEATREMAYAMYADVRHPDDCKRVWRDAANSLATIAHEIQACLWRQEIMPAQTEAVMASIAAYQDAPPATACLCGGRLHSSCRTQAQHVEGSGK